MDFIIMVGRGGSVGGYQRKLKDVDDVEKVIATKHGVKSGISINEKSRNGSSFTYTPSFALITERLPRQSIESSSQRTMVLSFPKL